MATYYWVGGSGTWNATSTTNWAVSSGGAGGAGVPTSADNAYFDAASNATAYTVTVGADAVCKDLTVAGPASGNVTFSLATSSRVNCFGSFTLPASGAVWTGTGAAAINFLSAAIGNTITTNGVTLTVTAVVLNNATGAWALGSALTTTSSFTLTNGSFDTSASNFTLTCTNFTAQAVATINANLSSIVCTAASSTFTGSGKTYYNVEFTSTAATTQTINGANTFNNLTFASRAAAGIGTVSLGADQIIAGTLTVQSGNTDPTRRIALVSNTIGSARTITASAITLGSGTDFRDITAAGVASPFDVSALQGGDCGGNTGITFPAAKTVYRIGTGNFSATQWAATSNGSPAADQFPLAQDTMVFDANTTTGTHTINANYNLGALDCSALTVAVTIASGTTNPTFYGNITLDSDVTFTGTNTWFFSGVGTQTIFSAGVVFPQPIIVNLPPTATFKLLDNLTSSNTSSSPGPGGGRSFSIYRGTLDLNNFTLSMPGLFRSGLDGDSTNPRHIEFGTGKIVLSGNDKVLWFAFGVSLTYSGSRRVELTYAGSTGTRLVGMNNGVDPGYGENNAVSIYVTGGSDIVQLRLSILGALQHYTTVDFTGFSGTLNTVNASLYGNLVVSPTMSLSSGGSITFQATSGTQQITTNGKTFDFPLTFNGVGSTFEFQDALTQGSTRAFTITNGIVKLKDGVTSTVGAFATSGTNQKFLQSTTAGSQATLSQASGTVNASNLTIQDINATGGATWQAFTTNNNVDAGNNLGWDFSTQIGRYIFTRRKNKRILP